jgi:hypothetical protein
LSETPFLEVSGKTVAIPKELQSFNEPGLKPDRPKEGEKRQRLQRRTFDAADSATKVQTKPEARKKSNRKKGESQKKRKEHKKESASRTPASEAVSLPVTPSNVTKRSVASCSKAVDRCRRFSRRDSVLLVQGNKLSSRT